MPLSSTCHDAELAYWQGTVSQGSDDSTATTSSEVISTPVSLNGDTFEALVDGSRMRGSYDSYMVPGAVLQAALCCPGIMTLASRLCCT